MLNDDEQASTGTQYSHYTHELRGCLPLLLHVLFLAVQHTHCVLFQGLAPTLPYWRLIAKSCIQLFKRYLDAQQIRLQNQQVCQTASSSSAPPLLWVPAAQALLCLWSPDTDWFWQFTCCGEPHQCLGACNRNHHNSPSHEYQPLNLCNMCGINCICGEQ